MSSLPQLSLAERLRDAVARLQDVRDTATFDELDLLLSELLLLRDRVRIELTTTRKAAWGQSGIGWVTLRLATQAQRARLLRTTKTQAIVRRASDAGEERFLISGDNLGKPYGAGIYGEWRLDMASFHAAMALQDHKE